MLSLYLMRVVEPGVLIEISINLLDLGDFPAVVLLSLRPIRLLPRLYLRIPLQCNFPRGTIDLLSQSFPRVMFMILSLIAVILLPSFRFRSRQCLLPMLLCENAAAVTCPVVVV